MAPLTERPPSSPSSNEFHTLILMALYPSPDPDFDSYKSTSAIVWIQRNTPVTITHQFCLNLHLQNSNPIVALMQNTNTLH